jgi:hypothetical protein
MSIYVYENTYVFLHILILIFATESFQTAPRDPPPTAQSSQSNPAAAV